MSYLLQLNQQQLRAMINESRRSIQKSINNSYIPSRCNHISVASALNNKPTVTSKLSNHILKMSLRNYQVRIADVSMRENTVVLLPTGAGKTFIAADVISRIGGMSLFFVPTIPLVGQQAAALRSRPNMPIVEEFHGEKSIPRYDFSVLVTTPKAFHTAQSRGEKTFSWDRFSVVVFDEVHHVIKNHPYRALALGLRESGCKPRIVGLTASLTYAVTAGRIAKSVGKLCKELQISCIEHADDRELREGGYKGSGRGVVAEVRLPNVDLRTDIVPRGERKPHLMHATFFNRINSSGATSFSRELVAIIRNLEKVVQSVDGGFKSPLKSSSLKKWGQYANGRVCIHQYYNDLQHWYEALRLLVTSWEEGEDAAIMLLRMTGCQDAMSWPDDTTALVDDFFKTQSISFVRFENMCKVLTEKVHETSNFRGIIFVQQRIMTHIVKHTIDQNQHLSPQIDARCLYATSTPASSTLAVSKLDAKEALRDFASGDANLLIATSVAEEGLDIPAANCVIYFDPMNHVVSYVQGRGRARQANSSFVMLDEREDRPAIMLAQQEVEQHKIASSFSPSTSLNQNEDLSAQRNRERNAEAFLENVTEKTALAKLNTFCMKTKIPFKEKWERCRTKTQCKLSYKSSLRTISVVATGDSKKVAKRKAAEKLLRALKSSRSS